MVSWSSWGILEHLYGAGTGLEQGWRDASIQTIGGKLDWMRLDVTWHTVVRVKMCLLDTRINE